MLPFEVLSRHAPWLRPPQSPFEQKTQMVHCRRARAAVSTPCLHCCLVLADMHARQGAHEGLLLFGMTMHSGVTLQTYGHAEQLRVDSASPAGMRCQLQSSKKRHAENKVFRAR